MSDYHPNGVDPLNGNSTALQSKAPKTNGSFFHGDPL